MDSARFGGPVAGPHTGAGADIAPWAWTDALAGAGALRASASDLLALAEAVLQPDATPLAEALRETTRSRALAPGRFRVGLVWHLLPAEAGGAPETVVHNGATFGSTAFFGVVPEAGVGVVVLTNGAARLETFAFEVLRRLASAR